MSEWKLVPVEPTRDMIAGTVDTVFNGAIEDVSILSEVYAAMLAAAPPAPSGEVLTDEEIDAVIVSEWGLDADADEAHGLCRAVERAVLARVPTTECTTCGATVVRVDGVTHGGPNPPSWPDGAREAMQMAHEGIALLLPLTNLYPASQRQARDALDALRAQLEGGR